MKATLRDFRAHVIQLCDYVEDLRIEPNLDDLDIGVIREKAAQVRAVAWDFKEV